jgi:dolichyl-diphosphooligosaccharide--protein glycosyltransferase
MSLQIQSVSKESKEWVENNKICDAPGSWFCRGQYPPALQKILKEKKDFRQLEDFNRDDEDDSDYQRAYFENLLREKNAEAPPVDRGRRVPKISPEEVDMINEDWENNEMTTLLWELIAEGHVDELREVFINNPRLAHIRSEDGRGPMW